MPKYAVLSLSLVCLLCGVARAADAPAASNAPAWSGPWLGVLGSAGKIEGEGALLGVSGGYDVAFDRIVVGVDGDISGGGVDARRAGGRLEVDALGTIRARVGYAFDRFVLFGAAGTAFASTEFARNGDRDRKTQFGWTVGGGLDVRLTEFLGARAEYIYVDLDRRTFRVDGGSGFRPSGGLARLGLNYRF